MGALNHTTPSSSKMVSNPKPGEKLGLSGNGNVQLVKGDKQYLFEAAVSAIWGKDEYYSSNGQIFHRAIASISALVKAKEFDYIANVIVFARKEMGMRTFPIAMTVQFAKQLRSNNLHYDKMRDLVSSVISRADELCELYAYSLTVFGKKNCIPLAIKKGVADAFNKFDEYQFAKYNRSTGLTLKDLLRIVHPTAKDEAQGALFAKIMSDTLDIPYTWETELSRNGQLHLSEQKSKSALWTELVTSGRMGYMATLRNLRNIAEAGVSPAIREQVEKYLTNPDQVKRSKQFPYAFINASLNSPAFYGACREAADLSLANIPKVGEKVVVILDQSGSMGAGPKSPRGIGGLFAAAIAKAHSDSAELAVVVFSSQAKVMQFDPEDSITKIMDTLDKGYGGGGTAFDRAVKCVDKLDFKPDTIFVLSDGDVNPMHYGFVPESWNRDALKICFNFAMSATTPMGENHGWKYLAGYSDKIFNYVRFLREGGTIASMLDVPFQPTKV